MSKNLRGLSGSSVTINLLDIDANSVTATTGTFTDIIATNYSINNVSINNLIVSGVVCLTGIVDAPVTLLPEYEILFKDPYNNLVYKFSSLVFNTTSGTLKSPDIITATMTVGDITVTGILTLIGSMPALQVTGQTDLGTGLSIQALASVASNSVHPLVLWNSTTKNISQDNTKLYYDTTTDTLYTPKISVTDFNIVPVTRSDNVEYPIVFYDDNTDNLAVDSIASNIQYNPSANRLTVVNCRVTQDLQVQASTFLSSSLYINFLDSVQSNTIYSMMMWDKNNAQSLRAVVVDSSQFYYDSSTDTLHVPNISATIPNLQIVPVTRSDDVDYKVVFFDDSTDKLAVDSGSTNFTYNPSTNTLKTNYSDIYLDLITGRDTFLGGRLYVNNINPVQSGATYGEEYPLIVWHRNASNGSRDVAQDFQNLYYDTTTNTLHAPNISGNFDIVATIKNDSIEYPVSFHDTTLNKLCIDGNLKFKYNPDENRLTVKNALINDAFEVVGQTTLTDTTMTGDTTISVFNARATPVNMNSRLLFLEGNTLTGRISGNGCYYNAFGDVLFANRLQGSVHSRSPEFLISYSGQANAQIKQNVHTDTERYLQYQQTKGHLFRTSAGPKLLITDSLSTIYTPFRCDGDCTIEYKPALASEARDMRVVVSDVDATDKTIKQHNQFTFNPSTTLLSVPNIDATGTVTAGALDVTNNMTVSGTFTCGDINFGNLDSTTAAAKITVQQPIHYGAGVFSQPLNYTIKIGTTDLIRTIDTASGTGLNSGKYGNGVTLSILRSGVKTTSYGQNSEIISWNPYIDATNTATNFTLGGLPGLWDIKMTCKYMSTQTGSSNRVNPIVRAVLNNTTAIDGGDQSSYIRHQVGRVGGIVWHNKIYLNTNDSLRFDTYVNFSGVIDFTSVRSSTDFDLSDFMFIATFLGPLDEYDKTPT
jgi:hypothetical protein